MIYLAAMAVFSGLSLNLLLQFALGTAGVAGDTNPKAESKRQVPLFQFGVMFLSVLFLWVFFVFMIPSYWRGGFSQIFLFFPFSALFCIGFEQLRLRLTWKFGKPKKVFSSLTAYEGLVPVSLLLTVKLAGSFMAALVLSLFFVIGNIVAILILNEIRRRSTLEWVPQFLRGSPLILISMGLLSLISAAVAGICFTMLDVF